MKIKHQDFSREFSEQQELSAEEYANLVNQFPKGNPKITHIFKCAACGVYHPFELWGAKYGWVCPLALVGSDGVDIQSRADFDWADFD